MELLDKIGGLKQKLEETEKSLHNLQKEINAKFSENDKKLNILNKNVPEIGQNLGDALNQIEAKFKEIDKKVGTVEADFNRFTKEYTKEEKEETGDIKEIKNTIESLKKDLLQRKLDISDVRTVVKSLSDTVKDSVKDIQSKFNDLDVVMKRYAELDKLHKHYAEIKMDFASTESALNKQVEDIKKEFNVIKAELQRFPKINDLQEQNVNVLNQVKALEKKVNIDFSKVVENIQEFGTIFAKKSQLSDAVTEFQSAQSLVKASIGEIKNRFADFEKDLYEKQNLFEVKLREREAELNKRVDAKLAKETGQLNRIVTATEDINRELNESREMLEAANSNLNRFQNTQLPLNNRIINELAETNRTTQTVRAELDLIREQVILTQNAIVELNAFLQEHLR